MASKEVLAALEVLHRELEKLEPAIKHVETAQQITQTVKDIPQKHLELLNEIKSSDSKHKEELKGLFSKELSTLSEENKKLLKTTSEIQEKHLELLNEIKSNDFKHKEELKGVFSKELSTLSEENKKLLKTTSEIQEQVKAELEVLGKLRDMVQSFHERVERINFPERIDKIDNQISAINIGVGNLQTALQNTQAKIDSFEKVVIQRIDNSENNFTLLLNKILAENKNMRIFLLISLALSVGIIILHFIKS